MTAHATVTVTCDQCGKQCSVEFEWHPNNYTPPLNLPPLWWKVGSLHFCRANCAERWRLMRMPTGLVTTPSLFQTEGVTR